MYDAIWLRATLSLSQLLAEDCKIHAPTKFMLLYTDEKSCTLLRRRAQSGHQKFSFLATAVNEQINRRLGLGREHHVPERNQFFSIRPGRYRLVASPSWCRESIIPSLEKK